MSLSATHSLSPTAHELCSDADALLELACEVMEWYAADANDPVNAAQADNAAINITAARMAIARAVVAVHDAERVIPGDEVSYG